MTGFAFSGMKRGVRYSRVPTFRKLSLRAQRGNLVAVRILAPLVARFGARDISTNQSNPLHPVHPVYPCKFTPVAKAGAREAATPLDNPEHEFLYCTRHVQYQPSPEVPKGRSRPPRQHQNRNSLSRATIVRPFLSGVVTPVTQRQSTRCVLHDPSVVNGSSGQKFLA